MELVQVAQRATDLERASAFYSRLLGSAPTAVFDPPGLVFFRMGSVRLLLESGAPSAMIYLEVPSVRLTVEDLRSQGVEVVKEPHVIFTHETDDLGPAGTDEWHAFIADSEGNSLGLVSCERPTG